MAHLGLYLAALFAIAAIWRATNPAMRRAEEERFGVPAGTGWAVVAFELWLAWGLARRNARAALYGAVFLGGATVIVLARHHRTIWSTLGDACPYDATATSVAAHTLMLLLLLHIYYTRA